MKKDTACENLFKLSLYDMYASEKQIVYKLSELAENAITASLGNLFLENREQAKTHIARLESIMLILDNQIKKSFSFATLDDFIYAQTILSQNHIKNRSTIVTSLFQEGDERISQFSSTKAADMVVWGIGEEVKHFEIASYKFLCLLASILNEKEIENILELSLEDKLKMEAQLQKIGSEVGILFSCDETKSRE